MARVIGEFVCRDCGNTVPIADACRYLSGSSGVVVIFPADPMCGNCNRPMENRYEEGRDGPLSRMHGRDLMGDLGGRDEGPAGRAGDEGRGAGPIPDRDLRGDAEDRAGERADAAPGDGGSPSDLPPTARHLSVGSPYVIRQGTFEDHVGELREINVTTFGHAFGVLDVHTNEGLVERGATVRAEHLESFDD